MIIFTSALINTAGNVAAKWSVLRFIPSGAPDIFFDFSHERAGYSSIHDLPHVHISGHVVFWKVLALTMHNSSSM